MTHTVWRRDKKGRWSIAALASTLRTLVTYPAASMKRPHVYRSDPAFVASFCPTMRNRPPD